MSSGVNADEENNLEPFIKEQTDPVSIANQLPTATAPEITNQIPGTENMEVHHHPNLHHQSKPWKEYLLEGLMIFIAVSMGFIAENIREHITDNNKGKEYMHSMYQDLKADTLELNKIIQLKTTDIVY